MTPPTVGRWVHYRLSEQDAEKIRHSRFLGNVHNANEARVGDVYPACIVRVNDSASQSVNLRVMLDGPDDIWVTSREPGPNGTTGSLDGRWFWPPRMIDVTGLDQRPGTEFVPGPPDGEH